MHKVQQTLILDCHHFMQRQRAIPLVRSKVQHQRNDRCDLIVLIEAGQVLTPAVSFRAIGAMLCCYVSNLLAILERIINDIANRHCIVNIGLVFDTQKDVSRFAILLDDRRFQHITVFLHRIIRLGSILVLRTKRQSYFCCIQFLQLCRIDNCFTTVNQIVKCICKYSIFFHIGFCDRIS